MALAVVTCLMICMPATGDEYENAVPLLLGLEAGTAEVQKIDIKLDGRQVTVLTVLENVEAKSRKVGWYATTPQFSIIGIGEEHLDKSFADVRATFNAKSTRAMVDQRGYFMGRDITAQLTRARLPALPSRDADAKRLARLGIPGGMRVDQWRGYVNYAWTATLPANGTAAIRVKYRPLPAFALIDLDSDDFARAVKQHCGDAPAAVRRVRAAAGAHAQVIIERYEVSIASLRVQDVNVSVVEPIKNWMDAHPVLSLACGVVNDDGLANIAGIVTRANSMISILVVSIPQSLPNALSVQ